MYYVRQKNVGFKYVNVGFGRFADLLAGENREKILCDMANKPDKNVDFGLRF